MKFKKLLIAMLLVIGAAGAARATKAREFIGYINVDGNYIQVYVPYSCPFTGIGCTYFSPTGYAYQVYLRNGLLFYSLKP